MSLWQCLGLAVAAAAACMVVRSGQPQLAAVCACAAGAMVLAWALEQVSGFKAVVDRLTALAGLEAEYLQPLLKTLGVSYASELAAQACAEMGENGLALKVGMAGKLCVLAMTSPLMLSVLEMILELVP